MKMKNGMKRVLSFLLTLTMVLGYIPVPAFAAEADGLCEHHSAHTADCGYAPAVAEQPCTHLHDGSCGYVEAVAEVLCDCEEVDEAGSLIHTDGCGYVAPVAGSDCTHAHDDACGYVEAVAEKPCQYHCDICLGHDHEDQDVPETSEHQDGDAAVAALQALVDALPAKDGITLENLEAVIAQLGAIDEAKWELTDEQRAQVDWSRYDDAAVKCTVLLNPELNETVRVAVTKCYVVPAGMATPAATFVLEDDLGLEAALMVGEENPVSQESVTVANGETVTFQVAPGTYTLRELVEGDWDVSMTVNGIADEDLTLTLEAGQQYQMLISNEWISCETQGHDWQDGTCGTCGTPAATAATRL